MASGSLFQRRAILNRIESTPNVLVFLFGTCNKFVALNYFMYFLSKSIHMNYGNFFEIVSPFMHPLLPFSSPSSRTELH